MFDWSIYRVIVLNRGWIPEFFQKIGIQMYLLDMMHSWMKTHFETWITRNDVNSVNLFHLSYLITFMVYLCTQRAPNVQIKYFVWLVCLQTICVKYVLETWFSPKDDIRRCLLDMNRRWMKNKFCDVNKKKWRKWCKFVSPFLFKITYGLPVPTTDTNCPNDVFHVWLVVLQTICAKHGLETWLSPNEGIRNYLLDMKHGSPKKVFWDKNNRKWRKWCELVSPFLFNNTYGLPVFTMDTKCPNLYFMFDWSIYRLFVLRRGWKLESFQIMLFEHVCSTWNSWTKDAFETSITRNDVNGVKLFHLSYLITLMAYLCTQRTPNVQIKYFMIDWSIYRLFVLNTYWKRESLQRWYS
jgi:hypothetical protein